MPESQDDKSYLEMWRKGDEGAAQKLFDRYVDQVLKLAKRHLRQRMAGRVDPEDIAQSVFRTFFHRAHKGQFHIEEPEDLCKLLARITVHKTFRQIAFHKRAKRDADIETGETQEVLLTRLASGPTPEEAVAFVDQIESFFSLLKPTDRQILEMRMEGYNNLEIAEKLGISDRKIRRLMERIRSQAEQVGMTP
ncbi:MAG: sigma-70 family RNA polymerase sigma factor [Planctomycetes bacterium]|nr:sigma-70 family RNA polymerase sigma factor [Planctomycetota bacterium]